MTHPNIELLKRGKKQRTAKLSHNLSDTWNLAYTRSSNKFKPPILQYCKQCRHITQLEHLGDEFRILVSTLKQQMQEKDSIICKLKIRLDKLEKVQIPPTDIIPSEKLQQLHETISEIKVKQLEIIAQQTHLQLETTNQHQCMQKQVEEQSSWVQVKGQKGFTDCGNGNERIISNLDFLHETLDLKNIMMEKAWTAHDDSLIIHFRFVADKLQALREKKKLFTLSTKIYLDIDLT